MSKTQKTKMISPKDAKSEKALLLLNRDNIDSGDFTILVGEKTVYLKEQALGKMPTQKIEIPKRDFNKLIKWYTTPQKIKP